MTLRTSRDYSGRTVDLEFLQTVQNPPASVQLAMTPAGEGISRRVTGIQKLAQRYALLFLTHQGTVRFNASQGTNFVNAAIGGSIQNRTALLAYFSDADNSVHNQLIAETNADDPDDEVLESSELTDFDLSLGTGSLRLHVSLISRAGETYTFIIPTA